MKSVKRLPFPNAMRAILNHPLSPVQLVVVFVGYWMPLEWMRYGADVIGNSTWNERALVIAASVFLSYLPAALLVALGVYPLAGLLSLFPGISFRKAAENGLSASAFFTLFAISIRTLKPAFLAVGNGWIKNAILVTLAFFAFWLTRKGIRLAEWMLVPRIIAGTVLAVSIVLLLLGWGAGIRYRPHTPPPPIHDMGATSGTRPDIILITVDTLSAGHLHTYGYQRPTSPHLDDFSQQSILFENFYANANWTRPGIASILNGARPWTHQGDLGMPLYRVTDGQNLLNRLADAGYDIRTVSSNDFADLEWQGIANVLAHREQLDTHSYLTRVLERHFPSAFIVGQQGPQRVVEEFQVVLRVALSIHQKTQKYAERSEALLRTAPANRPLFFWLHISSPHSPYATPAPYLGRFESSPLARTIATSQPPLNFHAPMSPETARVLEGRYDEGILMADDAIGNVLGILKKQGRFDRSLIVVTADHGESFNPKYGMHGGPLLLDEIIHIPYLLKPPYFHGAKRESGLFEQVDLEPTILSYANLPIPSGMEGQAYPGKPANVSIFSMNRDFQIGQHTLSVAMRDGAWKYVAHLGRWNRPWPQRELYNMSQDPEESTNLVGLQPERAEFMRRQILQQAVRHGVSLKEFEP
jgi:arylsulfatase A-like enzyme